MDGIITEKIPVNRLQKKEVTFHFGMWVWVGIAEKHGIAFEDFESLDQDGVITDALFFALSWPRMLEGKKPYPTEKVAKWVELIPARQMERILKCMMQSRVGGKTIMQLTSEAKKKQQPKG